MKQGKVWLVGAGPSDIGLFTIKGQQVLQQAEVVVYDRLVGTSLLTMIPEEAEQIDVGKRAGNHTMPQEEINAILLKKAQEGKKVVRLKGGDPFLFGRGGEELELLAEHKIPYEIVPGVTSAIAVPAYNGIPVTHRDFCSSLHIITGHKKKGERYDIDFDALVRTKGTLVFLMGVSALKDICESLLLAGMEEHMPAAMLQQGTTANQKRIVATVSTLVREVEKQGIATPAILVVGKVCSLADQFAWYETLPLFGCRVVLTRPKERISSLSSRLREKGAEVMELPAIRLKAETDFSALKEALDSILNYQWLVFTSAMGVNVFFDWLREEGKDIRILAGLKLAAVGPGTKNALLEKGLLPDFVPSTYDGVSLGRELAKRCEGKANILLPRAALGGKELVEELCSAGNFVNDIPIYNTELLKQRIQGLNPDGLLAVFTSASTVRGFMEATAFSESDCKKIVAACIGPQTRAEADRYGMQTKCAKKATLDDLVALVEELHLGRN